MASFDFDTFNQQKYLEASKEKIFAEDISRVLYPNDDTNEGKKLRLKQQYFFSCASLTDILRKHKARFGTLENLADYITIQLNDTHPVISVPELIRQLVDNEGYTFEKALGIAKKVFNYTNHTVMQEALEKWWVGLVEEVLPRIYEIIIQINEELIAELYAVIDIRLMGLGGQRISQENEKIDLIVLNLRTQLLAAAEMSRQKLMHGQVGHLFYQTSRGAGGVKLVLCENSPVRNAEILHQFFLCIVSNEAYIHLCLLLTAPRFPSEVRYSERCLSR